MGGGAQYPYPKHVWSPAGGWWSRPSNWKSNTAVVTVALGAVTYATWMYSAKRERKHIPVDRWFPSLHWADQYKGPEYDKFRAGTNKPGERV